MDKDIELQKIQTLDSNSQTWFNLVGSIVASAFIGLIITFITLYYEGLVNLVIYSIGFGAVYVAMYFSLKFMNKRSNEHLEYIDGLYAKIEKGEALPSLMELQKQSRKKK